MIRDFGHAFFLYNRKALTRKILELHKESDESVAQFWKLFRNLSFQFPKDEDDWKFLIERF